MIRRILQVLLPIVVLVVGGLGAKRLIDAYEEPEKRPVEVEPPLVEVIEAQQAVVRLVVQTEGTVAPRTESELVPEVAGRVVEISQSLAAGGFFDKDEVLIRVDDRDYKLAVTRAEAAVAQAKLRIAVEEQEAAVAKQEWESLGEGEPTALALRVPQLAEANAGLASAEAALEQARTDLARTVIRAPYDGRVRQKRVDVGQFIQRGISVATIYSTDIAEVRLPIPDDQLAFLTLPLAFRGDDAGSGPAVTLRTNFAGREHNWRGRIVRTEGEIDPRTRMVHAIAQVKDPYAPTAKGKPPLAVGMFVQADIQGDSVRVVPLPRTAMRGENQAWVVTEDNRIEFRELDIYRLERDRVLVTGGVGPGERVCSSTLEAAVNGMQVRVLETEAGVEVAAN